MKALIILYAGNCSHYSFINSFNSKSAFSLSLEWAKEFAEEEKSCIYIVCTDSQKNQILENSKDYISESNLISKDKWNSSILLKEVSELCKKNDCTEALFTFADYPFLDKKLSKELLETHRKYKAEYTFADGYPSGFAPVVINSGSAAIISALSEENKEKIVPVKESFIFEAIKSDVNSFELETIVSKKDYRGYRLNFSTDIKRNYLASKALFKNAQKKSLNSDSDSLSELAITCPDVLCTVPSFYNIQISSESGADDFSPYPACAKEIYADKNFYMNLENFKKLLDSIVEFSENAVISLSLWGEPLCNPDFIPIVKSVMEKDNISLLIETDGAHFSQEIMQELEKICVNTKACADYPKIMWILKSDYSKTAELVKIFGPSVYPQFLRTKQTEQNLEQFYRFWHDKESPSKGNLIIQKYDNYCGKMPDLKPADLSPLTRLPCWHLLRDMNILLDGSCLSCKERILDADCSNVFTDGISALWQKKLNLVESNILKDYPLMCRNCDEYYTFNF